jgi:hypothetical protein
MEDFFCRNASTEMFSPTSTTEILDAVLLLAVPRQVLPANDETHYKTLVRELNGRLMPWVSSASCATESERWPAKAEHRRKHIC